VTRDRKEVEQAGKECEGTRKPRKECSVVGTVRKVRPEKKERKWNDKR
jgi:hypothetical protein